MKLKKIPTHVALIMDGNRRWAKKHGLKATLGHKQAAEKIIEPIVDRAIKHGIKYITFWAFSTENWKRDQAELKALMKIFRNSLVKSIKTLHEKGVKLKYIGVIDRFPKDIAQKVKQMVKLTENNSTITVSFALNYGGRDEILRAVKKLVQDKPKKITEKVFAQYLDTHNLPDPDLIIRTGGEIRLSGYFPWQSVYSELYFTDTLWPEFSPDKFDIALLDYQNRDRRFGGNPKK